VLHVAQGSTQAVRALNQLPLFVEARAAVDAVAYWQPRTTDSAAAYALM
jgi:hypothetical protein